MADNATNGEGQTPREAPPRCPGCGQPCKDCRCDKKALVPVAPVDVLKRARYEDITRLILQGQNRHKQLAAASGVSTRQLTRILRDPEFIAIFDRAAGQLMENVDSVIQDEKVSLAVRKNAMHRRAVTLMAKITNAVDAEIEHAKDKGMPWNVRSTMLKAGVDAALGMIDRDTTEEQAGGSQHLHLHFSKRDADIMRGTMAEISDDVDITDIIDAEVVPDGAAKENPGE